MYQLLNDIFYRSLFLLGGQEISVWWLFKFLIAILAVSLLARYIKRFLKHRLFARFGIDGGSREAIATLISIGLGAFGYLIVLQATGIDLSSIVVVIGGLGVGIGFGLQDITKNLSSGLTVLIEQKLRVGDFIEFDGVQGYIEEISIRSTVIRRLQGGDVIIPNSKLAEERIVNWSYRDTRDRLEVEIGVAYGSDPILVTETLLAAAYAIPEVVREPAPRVVFEQFGDNALLFKLRVWVERGDRHPYLRSNLNFAVEYHLRQQNISIPFPQLDVHMRSPQTEDLDDTKSTSTSSHATNSPTHKTLGHWLSEISYFQHFNELQLRSLIEMGFRQDLVDGEIFARQGEKAREFCIVLEGAIAALHEGHKDDKPLFVFKAGQYFGELPLMLNVPYPTTVKAIGRTQLFVLNEAGFRHLLQTYQGLADDIAQELALRQELVEGYRKELRAMGMTTETDSNPVVWIRQRLKQLFAKPFT